MWKSDNISSKGWFISLFSEMKMKSVVVVVVLFSEAEGKKLHLN